MSVGAAAAEAAAALQRPREEERVKKKILLPEKTSVKERKNERKRERERWMNDTLSTNVTCSRADRRTVFFAAAQKPRERNSPFQRRRRTILLHSLFHILFLIHDAKTHEMIFPPSSLQSPPNLSGNVLRKRAADVSVCGAVSVGVILPNTIRVDVLL